MSNVKTGDTVRVHYTGKLGDGTPFDSSVGRDPLEFAIGGGNVIPGFESAVEGMAVGQSKSVTIEPEDAYGPRREQLVQEVPRTQLPDDMEPAVGMQLEARTESGQALRFMVTSVREDKVTIDGNHPLAGKTLEFDIELVAIV